MFRKIIAVIAAIAALSTPVAMAQDAVVINTAYVSADAQLVKQESEGAYTEYEFRDEAANAEIEALADASGNYVFVQTEYEVKRKKLTAKLDRDAAIKADTPKKWNHYMTFETFWKNVSEINNKYAGIIDIYYSEYNSVCLALSRHDL